MVLPKSRWELGQISPYDLVSSEHDRSVKPYRLRRLDNWCETLLDPLVLGLRADGSMVRLEGKHRGLKAIEHIENGRLPKDYMLPFRMVSVKSKADEGLFVIVRETDRKEQGWTPGDFWRERLMCEEYAKNLNDKVMALGFEIVPTAARDEWTQISCIPSLEKVDRHEGLLDATLRFIRTVWEGERKALTATAIQGTARFIYCHKGHVGYDHEAALLRLAGKFTEVVFAQRKALLVVGSEINAFSAGIRDVYNSGRPTGGRILHAVREWRTKP